METWFGKGETDLRQRSSTFFGFGCFGWFWDMKGHVGFLPRSETCIIQQSFFRIVSSNFFSRFWAFVTDYECKSCQCLLAYQKRRECLFVGFFHRWLPLRSLSSVEHVSEEVGWVDVLRINSPMGRQSTLFVEKTIIEERQFFCWESQKKVDVGTRRAAWSFKSETLFFRHSIFDSIWLRSC